MPKKTMSIAIAIYGNAVGCVSRRKQCWRRYGRYWYSGRPSTHTANMSKIGNQWAIPFMEMPMLAVGNVINGDASVADKQKVTSSHPITTITVCFWGYQSDSSQNQASHGIGYDTMLRRNPTVVWCDRIIILIDNKR